jgi:hypothetical protein
MSSVEGIIALTSLVGGIVQALGSRCSKNNNIDSMDKVVDMHFTDRSYILQQLSTFKIDKCGLFKVDSDGLLIYLNQTMLKYLGTTRDRALYHPMSINMTHDDSIEFSDTWDKYMVRRDPIIIKHRHMSDQNNMNYMISEAYPVYSIKERIFKGYKGITHKLRRQDYIMIDLDDLLASMDNTDVRRVQPPMQYVNQYRPCNM